MEDYHVDRPGVEVQQCMKLTGTNSSIGLIVLITHVHFKCATGYRLFERPMLVPKAAVWMNTEFVHRRRWVWWCAGIC